MTQKLPFAARITGTGSAFPAGVVTNHDLAKRIDTTDEWIRERTGIVERRIAERGNPAEYNSSLAARAAKNALEMAGKTAADIDAIFFATCTADTQVPSSACWLQGKIGATRAWGYDVNAACSGFVFALSTADNFIRTGQIKTALVVGSDVLSAFTNWEDRGSCILFADGAGAVIVERTDSDSPRRIISSHMQMDGTQWELFHTPAGGSNMEVSPECHAQKLDKMQMKGREIFRAAVKTLADFAARELESNGMTVADLNWLIPHQANIRIIEAVADRAGVPMEKVIMNIANCGNTSAATVPTALDQAVRDGRIQPGHTVLLDVFGAGLTFGSLLLRW